MNVKSRLHLVQNSSGAVVHTTEAIPEFEAVDVPGWQRRTLFSAKGLKMRVYKGEPGASWPIHSSGSEVVEYVVAYIVAGSGTVILKDPKTETISRVSYRAGDVIYFGPDTPHGWENGPEPCENVLLTKMR